MVTRLEAVRNGDWTYPLRRCDAETLARLIVAKADAQAVEKFYDEDLSDEETIAAEENGNLIDESLAGVETAASQMQDDLLEALLEYATAAATYAKHIGSASLPEWAEMIDILDNHEAWFACRMKSQSAERLIELEKSAANRLRIDKIIAELPTYKPPKNAKK